MQVIALLAALAVAGASSAHAHDSCPPADRGAIVQTVERFVAALAASDRSGLSKLVTPNLLVFDGGKRYEGMAIADMIAGLHRAGTAVMLTVNDPRVHVRCGMALVTFVDKGTLTSGDKVRNITWLESVVLEHDGKNWRVMFEHATQVPESK